MVELIAAARRWLPAILSGVFAALVLRGITQVPLPDVEPAHPPPRLEVRAPRALPDAPPARPLFPLAPSALPPADASAGADDTPPVLTGVASGAGRAVALLRSSTGATALLHTGETIDGWLLQAVSPSQVVVSRSGKLLTLELHASGAAK